MSELNQEQWDKKAIELGGSILQSWVWGEFQKSLGYEIHRIATDNSLCLAVSLDLPFNKKYIYCPRGPIGNTDEALSEIKKLARDRAIVFARLEPAYKMDLPKAIKDTQPTHNWLLSLEDTEEQILIGMKPKHRYNINLAARKGVEVKEGTQEDLLILWKLLLETSQRNKFRLHPQNYYWQIWDNLYPKNLRILIAWYEGKPLGGMILTLFGNTAIYMHGGSSSSLKDVMAPYLLHWEAIKLSKKLGMKYYDFGGIAPATEPNHSWAGITRFKKGFGGFELTTPGSYDLVFSPIWYNVYKQGRRLRNNLMLKRS
jgi:peptidoglycan pentaglycine glycine transferase (the first glycine)